MKLTKKILATVGAMLAASILFAEDAATIAKTMLELPVPDYSFATLVLDVIEKNGKSEQRIIKEYGGGENGLKNAVFVFTAPAAYRDTRILQCEKTNKDDDKWVYQPSLRTTRRLGTGERSKSFVGTELTYNDMSTRKVGEDTHEMISENETVTVKSKAYGSVTYNCWKLKETPIKSKARDVEYAYRMVYVDKATYLPVKYENFNKAGKHVKTMVIEKAEPVQGEELYQLRRSVNVVNEETGRQTHVFVKDFTFDKKISPAYFTQQFLSTGKVN